jgi:hypothetical protein
MGAQKFYFLHDLCLRFCKSQLTYVDAISTFLLPALSMTGMGMGPVARKLPTYLSTVTLFETGASGTYVQIYTTIPAANVFNVSSQRLHNSWTQRKQRGSQPLRD